MRRLLLLVRRSCVIMPVRKYQLPADWKPAHMNELPTPCGPWGPWYAKKQSKYSATLFVGVAWFLISVGMTIYTGSLYLNWGPPDRPSPPVEEDDEDSDTLPNIGLPPC